MHTCLMQEAERRLKRVFPESRNLQGRGVREVEEHNRGVGASGGLENKVKKFFYFTKQKQYSFYIIAKFRDSLVFL